MIGGGRRLEGIREVRKIVRGEIMGALNKIKRCKTAGMDVTAVKRLKNIGINIIDWLVRILNRCMYLVLYQMIERQRVSSLCTKGKMMEETVEIIEEYVY